MPVSSSSSLCCFCPCNRYLSVPLWHVCCSSPSFCCFLFPRRYLAAFVNDLLFPPQAFCSTAELVICDSLMPCLFLRPSAFSSYAALLALAALSVRGFDGRAPHRPFVGAGVLPAQQGVLPRSHQENRRGENAITTNETLDLQRYSSTCKHIFSYRRSGFLCASIRLWCLTLRD